MSFCRICLDEDNEENLIAPCLCNGTSKYVHFECIEEWRVNNPNQEAQEKCMECNAPYKLVNKYPKETFFINFKTDCFIKNFLRPYIFILPSIIFLIPIDMADNYQSLRLLDSIYFNNITSIVINNNFYYAVYYYTLASSLAYVNVYLLGIILYVKNVKRKLKYFLYAFPGYILCVFLSCGYIYLYLMSGGYINIYFVLGVISPIYYYFGLIWYIQYFHNYTLNKFNKNLNNFKYLEYHSRNEENITIRTLSSNSSFEEPAILQSNDLFVQNTHNEHELVNYDEEENIFTYQNNVIDEEDNNYLIEQTSNENNNHNQNNFRYLTFIEELKNKFRN